jgi:DNA-binding XRE family transcriptional regulator
MLAVVKKPRIEIRAKHIPAPLVRFLKYTYKPENVAVCKNDDSISFEESDWFKNLDSTPGEMIVANRDLRNWSQVTLAEKLGIQVQNLCAMENGRRAVSRKMAIKLGEIFGTDPAAFFDFSK